MKTKSISRQYKSIDEFQQRDIKDIFRMRKYALLKEKDFTAK